MIMVTKNRDDDDENLSASESHVSFTRYRRPPHLAFVLPGHHDDDCEDGDDDDDVVERSYSFLHRTVFTNFAIP